MRHSATGLWRNGLAHQTFNLADRVRVPGGPLRSPGPSYYISILPTWDDQYSARRFLAPQRVEAVHRQFEAPFGLGGKNPGVDRRMIKATHRNRVWWAVACLIWNFTLRMNIDSGRTLIAAVPRAATRDGELSIETVVKGSWDK